MTGAPEGSNESISGEAGNQTCDPWFTRHSAYPLQHGGLKAKKNLVADVIRILRQIKQNEVMKYNL